MISSEEFRKLWNTNVEDWSKLTSYNREVIQHVPISDVTREFLIDSGLPEGCAPFLSFNQKIYYEGIKNIKEEYELENDDFVNHYVIGSSDNVSICVDVDKDDRIFQIDFHHVYNVDSKEDLDYHEEFTPIMFMNSSIAHLAHCILVYRNFVDEIRSVRDNQSVLEIQPQEKNSAN